MYRGTYLVYWIRCYFCYWTLNFKLQENYIELLKLLWTMHVYVGIRSYDRVWSFSVRANQHMFFFASFSLFCHWLRSNHQEGEGLRDPNNHCNHVIFLCMFQAWESIFIGIIMSLSFCIQQFVVRCSCLYWW